MQHARFIANFLLRAAVVGLAIAFLVVWWKPGLLGAAAVPIPIFASQSNRAPVVMQSFADAVARALGCHDAKKGIAANTAPMAPVPTVAAVNN